jgi:hypothetical protein
MQFLLYEIVARIVAIYLCVDSVRKIRLGLAERKIKPFNADVVNWILDSFRDPSSLIVHRDTAPVTYWISIGIEISILAACLTVAIFGWWHPSS